MRCCVSSTADCCQIVPNLSQLPLKHLHVCALIDVVLVIVVDLGLIVLLDTFDPAALFWVREGGRVGWVEERNNQFFSAAWTDCGKVDFLSFCL